MREAEKTVRPYGELRAGLISLYGAEGNKNETQDLNRTNEPFWSFSRRLAAAKRWMDWWIGVPSGEQKPGGQVQPSLRTREAQIEKLNRKHSQLRTLYLARISAPFGWWWRANRYQRQLPKHKNLRGTSAPIPASVAAHIRITQKGTLQINGRGIRLRQIAGQDDVTGGPERISARK